MTSFYVTSFICQVHVCICNKFYMTSFHMTSFKPVFHFARTVPKRTGEHAQIEKRFINPRTSGHIRDYK